MASCRTCRSTTGPVRRPHRVVPARPRRRRWGSPGLTGRSNCQWPAKRGWFFEGPATWWHRIVMMDDSRRVSLPKRSTNRRHATLNSFFFFFSLFGPPPPHLFFPFPGADPPPPRGGPPHPLPGRPGYGVAAGVRACFVITTENVQTSNTDLTSRYFVSGARQCKAESIITLVTLTMQIHRADHGIRIA